MIKRIFFQTLFLNFLFLKNVSAAESGGMPQLNPEFWISQIFWLIITFGVLYVILSKLILPKISKNLESRKSQISDNIEAADKQRKESEDKIEEYEKIINQSKIEAKNIFNQVKEKALKDINSKKENLDKQIEQEIKNAEEEIKGLRKDASTKINKIAIDLSDEIIKKLIGAEINNSSISAIVNDLYKKDGDKYYGN